MSSQGQERRPDGRQGVTSPVVIMLLTGILAALVVLIVVLVTQRGGNGPGPYGPPGEPSPPVIAEGRKVSRSELVAPPKSPKPIDDPDRI